MGRADMLQAIVEPRRGGRWCERGSDGSECDWGGLPGLYSEALGSS